MFLKKFKPEDEHGLLRRRATRCVFFIVGFAFCTWAPLIPYVKTRLSLNEAELGLLMICLGAGSLITMPLTGALVARFSCRSVIMVWTTIMCISLPTLTLAGSWGSMAFCLLIFGGAVGGIDVAANIQGLMVQKESRRLMMSGFHAFYSIGSLAGAAGMSAMLYAGLTPEIASTISAVFTMLLLLKYRAHILPHIHETEGQPSLALPRGRVIVIGVLCFITYLAEGVISDWGGLYLIEYKGFDPSYAGLSVALFSIALAIGRLWGDSLISAMGGAGKVMFMGGIAAALGVVSILVILPGMSSLIGFFLVGLGCSNIVPIIFTATGKQNDMPINSAVSAVTTMGYSGILLGPAFIGFLSHATSLVTSFWVVGLLLALLALGKWLIFPKDDAA